MLRSLQDWLTLSGADPSLLNTSAADLVAGRIIENGFSEPLTQRDVPGTDIDASVRDWREGLVAHGLTSRARGVLALIGEKLENRDPGDCRIFATEAVTAFALLLKGRYARCLCSEYGEDDAAKGRLYPISHQDLTSLDLPSGVFDLVTTNEVLEHVPDLDRALTEIARVLKPGGWHVGTHPFQFMSEKGDLRTKIIRGRVVHLKEPEYHGNPVAAELGSLVYETPGWNIIERAYSAGFIDVHMRFVASEAQGILSPNTGIFVLCAKK